MSEERSNTMTHKHLEEVDPSTLSPDELRERLTWRDEHPAEVIRAERERAAQQRLDEEMVNARDGFLLAGGDARDWAKVEKQIRDELVRDAAKAEAEAAHAAAFRQMRNNF
jgi:hypothetical protein